MENSPYTRIRQRLKEMRRNYTWLADKLGVDPSWISRAMTKGSGLEASFRNIAALLQVSIDWLWNGGGEESGMFRALSKDQEEEIWRLKLQLKQYQIDYQRKGLTPPAPVDWPGTVPPAHGDGGQSGPGASKAQQRSSQ